MIMLIFFSILTNFIVGVLPILYLGFYLPDNGRFIQSEVVYAYAILISLVIIGQGFATYFLTRKKSKYGLIGLLVIVISLLLFLCLFSVISRLEGFPDMQAYQDLFINRDRLPYLYRSIAQNFYFMIYYLLVVWTIRDSLSQLYQGGHKLLQNKFLLMISFINGIGILGFTAMNTYHFGEPEFFTLLICYTLVYVIGLATIIGFKTRHDSDSIASAWVRLSSLNVSMVITIFIFHDMVLPPYFSSMIVEVPNPLVDIRILVIILIPFFCYQIVILGLTKLIRRLLIHAKTTKH